MKNFRQISLLVFLWVGCPPASAQLYTGPSRLTNTSPADMNEEGTACISGHFMNKHFAPGDDGRYGFIYDGEEHNTVDFYLSFIPLRWVEIGYTFTLQKSLSEGYGKSKYNQRDRYFSVKLSPLHKGRYYPIIVIGSNDFLGSPTKQHGHEGIGTGYFYNYYTVATKHFKPLGYDIGVSLAYRYRPTTYSEKWEDVVDDITRQPKQVPGLYVIAEYTENEVNISTDCSLWKYLPL